MRVVIPSRGRHKLIGKNSLSIFPDAFVCVDESEVSAYRNHVQADRIIPHPPLSSLASIRNWIIDNAGDGCFFMADDDLTSVVSYVGRKVKEITSPVDIMQIVDNALEVAQGIGVTYFGFCQTARPWRLNPLLPFRYNTWVGTAVGVIGEEFHYDERLSLRDDFDFSMQHLLKDRIIFQDERFFFASEGRLKAAGGNSAHRSQDRDAAEIRYLRRKWGKYVWIGEHAFYSGNGTKGVTRTIATSVKVDRKQK